MKRRREIRHWMLGALGGLLVLGYGWAALQSDPEDPGGMYLLRAGFLSGALGALGAWALHRARGWSLTVPRVMGLSGVAAAVIGPAGASLLGIDEPGMTDLLEWLEFGVLGGLAFAMTLYGWRGEMSEGGR